MRAVVAARMAPAGAVARSTVAARAAVDRTFGRGRCFRDHRTRPDDQHLAFDQEGGDGVASPQEDTRIGLSRHPHPFGRRILIEALQVRETDRFELVQADGNRVGLARRSADRTEAPSIQLAADATGHHGSGHAIKSICS